MGSSIYSIEYYLPESIIDNKQLSQEFPEWEAEKIQEKVGIRNRHICSKDETALDLAYFAAEKVLQNFNRDAVDFVILCTQSPDYFLPTGACILQDKLKLRKDIGAFDFNLGCSGFIYGLALSKSLINSNIASCVLLIMAESYSKHIHPSDKSNRSIFGDGAAATLVVSSEEEKIHEFLLGTDGSGKDNLVVKRGGMRFHGSENKESVKNFLYMNGPEIFNFTLDIVPDLVKNIVVKNNISIEQVDYIIFHQANKYMLEYLCKKLKCDPAKFYINMLETGNTVSATIPIAMKDCLDKGILKSGNKVLFAGFGVGYSWGATIITI
ncbi:MAG: ketoacyl-ACP synthase III [Bacteroidales bacterium]|nr:ketoacyl-ACP synthase III [Bacteroidales bacterium]